MVTHQHRILMIMESMKFEYEVVDIAGPGMDDAKDFMRANSKKKENERHALPPQIFNGEKYCGVSFYLELKIVYLFWWKNDVRTHLLLAPLLHDGKAGQELSKKWLT